MDPTSSSQDKREIIKLGGNWSKNKLSRLKPEDKKLVEKGFKNVIKPNDSKPLTKEEYDSLINILKQPQQSKKTEKKFRITNIFQKIHTPWSKESQIYSKIKKAEGNQRKEVSEKFYSGLSSDGVKTLKAYFKEQNFDAKLTLELMRLANPLISPQMRVEERKTLISFANDRLIDNPDNLFQPTKILLSEKVFPSTHKTIEYVNNTLCKLSEEERSEIMNLFQECGNLKEKKELLENVKNFVNKTYSENTSEIWNSYTDLAQENMKPAEKSELFKNLTNLKDDETWKYYKDQGNTSLESIKFILSSTKMEQSRVMAFVKKLPTEINPDEKILIWNSFQKLMMSTEQSHRHTVEKFIWKQLMDPVDAKSIQLLIETLIPIPQNDKLDVIESTEKALYHYLQPTVVREDTKNGVVIYDKKIRKPIEVGELCKLIKGLSNTPKNNRDYYIRPGKMEPYMKYEKLGTHLSQWHLIPQRVLKDMHSYNINFFFKNELDLELMSQKLNKIPEGKEQPAMDFLFNKFEKFPKEGSHYLIDIYLNGLTPELENIKKIYEKNPSILENLFTAYKNLNNYDKQNFFQFAGKLNKELLNDSSVLEVLENIDQVEYTREFFERAPTWSSKELVNYWKAHLKTS